jgi:methyl-accepting chemotaxis protein
MLALAFALPVALTAVSATATQLVGALAAAQALFSTAVLIAATTALVLQRAIALPFTARPTRIVHRIEAAFQPQIQRLRNEFNALVDKVRQATATIGADAQAIGSGTGAISAVADELSRRTEQQATASVRRAPPTIVSRGGGAAVRKGRTGRHSPELGRILRGK